MKNARNICAIAGIIGGFMMLAGTSSADTLPGPTPQPPRSLPELTAEWWQWVFSIPQPFDAGGNPQPPFNPILDPSGTYCAVGQRGSVWLLAGDALAQGQPPVQRSCVIPEGVSILFPVINFFNFNSPGCPTGFLPMNAQALLVSVKQAIEAVNSTNSISATVDGVNVTKTLVKFVESQPFTFAFPAQNFFGPAPCAPGVPLAPKTYSPSVAEGYYVWLPPLTVGKHRISFFAYETTAPSNIGSSYQNVIYNITVCSAAAEFSGTCTASSGS
jgi:hypothetical protein